MGHRITNSEKKRSYFLIEYGRTFCFVSLSFASIMENAVATSIGIDVLSDLILDANILS